ncbi:MAG: peroxiredoxin family protein, partial [Planctomycetales bacterium]
MRVISGLILSLGMVVAIEAGVPVGTQAIYRGTLDEDRTSDATATAKAFTVTLLCSESDESGGSFYWLVKENGRGSWHWTERFGETKVGEQGTSRPAASGPSVVYEHESGKSAVPLPPPLFITEGGLAAGKTWTNAKRERFQVIRATKLGEREVWEVAVADPVGRSRKYWVDCKSSLLVAYQSRVFMNMGTEYVLDLKLEESKMLSPTHSEAHRKGFQALVEMRSKLDRKPRETKPDLTPSQLKIIQAALPNLKTAAAEGPLTKLIALAGQDVFRQSRRETDVSKLAEVFEGKPAPTFELDKLGVGKLTSKELKGRVTVLHFWEYRDRPLVEPYGQVGYLDFLHNKRGEEGINILGVAVNGDLGQPDGRAKAIRGVRKLKAFMNLG